MVTPRRYASVLALVLALSLTATGRAQDANGIRWTVGPAKVALGANASLDVPAGYRFADASGARRYMELTQNLYSNELGVLEPVSEKETWFILFDFNDVGYVKDDDKLDDSTINAILDSIKKGTEAANKERSSRGWDTMSIVGWSQRPFYDPVTHSLTWAILGASNAGAREQVVNYDARVLGRRGTMQVQMVLDPAAVQATMPKFQGIVKAVTFNAGDTYAEFRSGDKIAKYGLVGLMTGVGAVAAVKFWKPLIALGAVVVGLIGKFFKKIAGIFGGQKAPS
jgi:uncharacterized membrane-anchored protein